MKTLALLVLAVSPILLCSCIEEERHHRGDRSSHHGHDRDRHVDGRHDRDDDRHRSSYRSSTTRDTTVVVQPGPTTSRRVYVR